MNGNVVPKPIAWPESFRLTRTVPPGADASDDVAGDSDRPDENDKDRAGRSMEILARVVEKTQMGNTNTVSGYLQNSPFHSSRFSDGSYRVWYAGDSEKVALAETVHHHQKDMRRDGQPPGWSSHFLMQVAPIDGILDDVNAVPGARDLTYDVSQPLGAMLKAQGSNGVVWDSVRHAVGSCIGLFKGDVAGIIKDGDCYRYHWDGSRVDKIENVSKCITHVVTETSTIEVK